MAFVPSLKTLNIGDISNNIVSWKKQDGSASYTIDLPTGGPDACGYTLLWDGNKWNLASPINIQLFTNVNSISTISSTFVILVTFNYTPKFNTSQIIISCTCTYNYGFGGFLGYEFASRLSISQTGHSTIDGHESIIFYTDAGPGGGDRSYGTGDALEFLNINGNELTINFQMRRTQGDDITVTEILK